MKYWAHSDPLNLPETHPNAKWQPLNQHLRQVAALAEGFAKEAQPNDPAFQFTAKATGLLHDLGKYTQAFQDKIRGKPVKAPHSAYGAALAFGCGASEAAFAIAGHHAGLPNPKGDRACLRERIKDIHDVLDNLWETAVRDCPELSVCRDSLPRSGETLANFDLRTRMLLVAWLTPTASTPRASLKRARCSPPLLALRGCSPSSASARRRFRRVQ